MRLLMMLLIAVGVWSCGGQKAMVSSLPLEKNLPEGIYYSPQFRMLWTQMVEETTGKKNMKSFKPSKEMVENFSLSKDDEGYTCSGYLKVKAGFDADKFKSLGGTLVKFSDTRYTFTFPVKGLSKMFELDGIEAIELARKLEQIR